LAEGVTVAANGSPVGAQRRPINMVIWDREDYS
jgi:hypothetical protein